MISYNVEGIVSKLRDTNFVSFMSNYDYVCLVETFVDSFTTTLFPNNNTSFVAPAKKLSQQRRKSGGVIVLVKNALLRFLKRMEVNYDNVIVLELS